MLPRRLPLLLLAALLALPVAAAAQRARTNYLLHCSGCHAADGSGSAENGIPNMQGRVGHFLRLPEGRAFLVQVPGTSQSSLNDADTAEMLNWMVQNMSRAEVPPDFVPYSAAEVTRLRADRLDDAAAVRTAIAGRLRGMGFVVD